METENSTSLAPSVTASRIYAHGKSQEPPQDDILPFKATDMPVQLQYHDGLGTPIMVNIQVALKGLSLYDGTWTCYRKNYFSCTSSFSLQPQKPNIPIQFTDHHAPQLIEIPEFAISMSATVSDGKESEILEMHQYTTKRDNPERMETVLLNPKPNRAIHPNIMDSCSDVQHSPTEHTFERIRFKRSTRNYQRPNRDQEYCRLRVELWAKFHSHVDGPCSVKVAARESERFIIKGRSPGYYESSGPDSQCLQSRKTALEIAEIVTGGETNFAVDSTLGSVNYSGSGFDNSQDPDLGFSSTNQEPPLRGTTRRRVYQSCERCRERKTRCERPSGQTGPCKRCSKDKHFCKFGVLQRTKRRSSRPVRNLVRDNTDTGVNNTDSSPDMSGEASAPIVQRLMFPAQGAPGYIDDEAHCELSFTELLISDFEDWERLQPKRSRGRGKPPGGSPKQKSQRLTPKTSKLTLPHSSKRSVLVDAEHDSDCGQSPEATLASNDDPDCEFSDEDSGSYSSDDSTLPDSADDSSGSNLSDLEQPMESIEPLNVTDRELADMLQFIDGYQVRKDLTTPYIELRCHLRDSRCGWVAERRVQTVNYAAVNTFWEALESAEGPSRRGSTGGSASDLGTPLKGRQERVTRPVGWGSLVQHLP
ncbi:hypothetical protein FSARC_5288 [Fusarium sarcochroum]|uniref:Zn(2)-C6 fungal-type domain-containing protein n=1 Tax=Fusarium sarcochroum TaxID=1208366 RepID=A0A8H4X9P1_9HYPO|nr:hypothetical protein FSARC_5288 [Fusarium sarcochroum]